MVDTGAVAPEDCAAHREVSHVEEDSPWSCQLSAILGLGAESEASTASQGTPRARLSFGVASTVSSDGTQPHRLLLAPGQLQGVVGQRSVSDLSSDAGSSDSMPTQYLLTRIQTLEAENLELQEALGSANESIRELLNLLHSQNAHLSAMMGLRQSSPVTNPASALRDSSPARRGQRAFEEEVGSMLSGVRARTHGALLLSGREAQAQLLSPHLQQHLSHVPSQGSAAPDAHLDPTGSAVRTTPLGPAASDVERDAGRRLSQSSSSSAFASCQDSASEVFLSTSLPSSFAEWDIGPEGSTSVGSLSDCLISHAGDLDSVQSSSEGRSTPREEFMAEEKSAVAHSGATWKQGEVVWVCNEDSHWPAVITKTASTPDHDLVEIDCFPLQLWNPLHVSTTSLHRWNHFDISSYVAKPVPVPHSEHVARKPPTAPARGKKRWKEAIRLAHGYLHGKTLQDGGELAGRVLVPWNHTLAGMQPAEGARHGNTSECGEEMNQSGVSSSEGSDLSGKRRQPRRNIKKCAKCAKSGNLLQASGQVLCDTCIMGSSPAQPRRGQRVSITPNHRMLSGADMPVPLDRRRTIGPVGRRRRNRRPLEAGPASPTEVDTPAESNVEKENTASGCDPVECLKQAKAAEQKGDLIGALDGYELAKQGFLPSADDGVTGETPQRVKVLGSLESKIQHLQSELGVEAKAPSSNSRRRDVRVPGVQKGGYYNFHTPQTFWFWVFFCARVRAPGPGIGIIADHDA
eukprot:CAMPEP_0118985072 /NCGR_PEP_ID=MMETSP1173-20130426/39101_1 /TAXON_ID=1034831 /ORGANISM="Rhizochromulina marina cf, Strain CCMP1243" /LENGTH=744 /DNA_ID=CAMNT_0006935767 /DNA_START=69 /DNA_END=2300 /DNA_ORIENTATION=-